MLSSKPLRYLKVFSQLIHLSNSKKLKSLYLLNEKVLSCLQKIRLNTVSKGFVIMFCYTFIHNNDFVKP